MHNEKENENMNYEMPCMNIKFYTQFDPRVNVPNFHLAPLQTSIDELLKSDAQESDIQSIHRVLNNKSSDK